MSILENLTSFALIYFHKLRILTRLAHINFFKLAEKFANSQKLVRFSKPSVVNWKYTKRKFFYLLTPTNFFLEFSTSTYAIPKLISKYFSKFNEKPLEITPSFENWIEENFFLYFWLVKIPLFLKHRFRGCWQAFPQEIRCPLLSFKKYEKSTAESCRTQSNLINDKEFSSLNFLKLKYRRGDQITQLFCRIGSPQEIRCPLFNLWKF